MVSESTIPEGDALKIKEWEVERFQDEIAASQGIKIRRRPVTGPPLHYVGPFEFRLQNEGNTPCNILEEIIWYKDKEVSQVSLGLESQMPLEDIYAIMLLFIIYYKLKGDFCLPDEREETPPSTEKTA